MGLSVGNGQAPVTQPLAQASAAKKKSGPNFNERAVNGVRDFLVTKPTELLTGGAPKQSYLGGSKAEQEAQRAQLNAIGQSATTTGQEAYGQGIGVLGGAAGQSSQNRDAASTYAQGGMALGQQGINNQNLAIGRAEYFASQPTDSLAQLQLRQQANANQGAMLAQAASARGGNQAAALRIAQANAAQIGNATNQAAAQMRAAEQQAAINRNIAVQQMAVAAGGQQAGLGYGMQGQGLGLAQGATGQYADIGAQQASAGLGQQNVGLGAYGVLTDRDKAQYEADRAHASSVAASRSPAAAFGGVLGGVTQLWGGGK